MRRSFGVHDELKKELANLDKALSSRFARSCTIEVESPAEAPVMGEWAPSFLILAVWSRL